MKLTSPPTAAASSIPRCTLDRLLAAVPEAHRGQAMALLSSPRHGGRGLRALLAMMDTDDRALPGDLPAEVVAVYLIDDEAEPLHDCGECGLPVPVRAGRRCGHEATVERVYFPTCPSCGGRTGRHAYWSRSYRIPG